MGSKNLTRGPNPLIRKECRKSYDEYAKYDEASTKATLTGDKKVVSIEFNPAVVDPEDTETLADMTVQAINAAIEEIDAATKKKLGAFAGKLPF